MILVHTEYITPKIEYIFQLIFTDILGVDYRITISQEEYNSYDGAKINYSKKELGGLNIAPSGLLDLKGILEVKIQVDEVDGVKVFYKTGSGNDFLSYDIFSASFYLVTRLEEYSETELDKHGRFQAENSLAFKEGFLTTPIVNVWAEKLKEILISKFSTLQFSERKFDFISTIDIDNAFAFKEKGAIRTRGAFVKDMIKGNMDQYKRRKRVLKGEEQDPYDTYDYLRSIQEKYGLKMIYFFLLGDYAKYDRNVNYENKKQRQLIQNVSQYAEVGIHPSYASNEQSDKVKAEIKRLKEIVGFEISKSRQHFLRLFIPETYYQLIDTGIKEDYSMGYASQAGFRAGICTAYTFYDIINDKPTSLKIVPFSVMDGTLNEYMKLSVEEAEQVVKELIDNVKSVNGTFISIWHNETLNDERHWTGWKQLYEYTCRVSCEN